MKPIGRLTPDTLQKMDAYWRAANYLSVGQIYLQDNPLLELELTVESTPVLLDQIRRGTLDAVFAALPASAEGIRSQALTPMEMVFVGNSKIHRKRRYASEDFAGTDILTFQRGSQPHVYLLDTLRQAQVEPRCVHTISSISAMVQLVQGGFGVATLPRLAGQHAQYTENQLKQFNKRERTNDNAVMHVVVQKMTELEMAAVAEYVSGK